MMIAPTFSPALAGRAAETAVLAMAMDLFLRERGGQRTGMAPKDEYLDWKKQGITVGCVFARYLAARPDQCGQRIQVVNVKAPEKIAKRIDLRVSEWVKDGTAEGAVLILPSVKDASDLSKLVEIALALEALGWRVERRNVPTTPCGPMVAFGMSRHVVHAGGKPVPSEALVLGPFDVFPNTRRAPVTAVEIFVGTPSELDRDGKSRQKANLADINVPFPQTVFDQAWEKTKQDRLASLGGEDDRAKAKVSFVVPLELAKSLGCAP